MLYIFITCIVFICSCAAGALFFVLSNNSIDFSQLEYRDLGKPTVVLDDQGVEWARFALDRRQPITYDNLPQVLINAFVSAEDHTFFSHKGLSPKAIMRSVCVNIYHGRCVQGASTITQQLVKLLYTDGKKTFSRKIKDQILALLVERQYTKEQILQAYLNNVCFGCGIYGVQAASRRFWSKSVEDLSLDQAATLAAIVQSPARYCPLTNPLSCQKRRDFVLHSLYKLGFINQQELEEALETPLQLNIPEVNQLAPHLKENLRIFLEQMFGKETLYKGGLVVKTTMNRFIQEQAQDAFFKQISLLRQRMIKDVDGGLLTIEAKTGQIKALVGGFDFSTSQFNRAFQAKRQMASIFKLIIYATAIAKGFNCAHTEIDEPLSIILSNGQLWQPRNSTNTFAGQMSLAYALSRSNNIFSIKMLMHIGCDLVIKMAQKFRIQATLQPYPSLALGCVDVTLKEVAQMFNVFTNNGSYVKPYFVQWVKDQWGKKVYTTKPEKEQIISPLVSGQIAKALMAGMERAKARSNNGSIDCEAFSKTGTTNDARVNWFVGATPELTTAVYVGCDDNRSMGNVFPVSTAFPIWWQMHQKIPCKKKKFNFDPALKEVLIHARTGEIITNSRNVDALSILI